MAPKYIHEHKDFPDLLTIIGKKDGILAGLVEKDYWIMHVLYGLSKQGFSFELKGGTSLSKGYKIINRFSEDIDIQINPPPERKVNTNPKNTNPNALQSREQYYDWLESEIKIDGIVSVERDREFDTKSFGSGGIRLHYKSYTEKIEGVKEGILLELGFDTVTPNSKLTISSWVYDKASETSGISIIDNRAIGIACYHPGYTLVEKLQTITTKFRQETEEGKLFPNLMRQYYDVFSLLSIPEVQKFIGTEEYHKHKDKRFSNKDKIEPITDNEAFKLTDPKLRGDFRNRYKATAALYYKGQPDFDDLLKMIANNIEKL